MGKSTQLYCQVSPKCETLSLTIKETDRTKAEHDKKTLKCVFQV